MRPQAARVALATPELDSIVATRRDVSSTAPPALKSRAKFIAATRRTPTSQHVSIFPQLLAVAVEVAAHLVEVVAAELLAHRGGEQSATIASPMTPAAGTAVTSERSKAAASSSFVSMSTERSGVRSVEMGLR